MNWTEILNFILGGGTLIGFIQTVRYRKANKVIKDNEAKVSSVETQRQEMELAELYKNKVLELVELINIKQDKGNNNQDKMIEMLGNLDTRVDSLEARVSNVEGCLNGHLKEYVAKKNNPADEQHA